MCYLLFPDLVDVVEAVEQHVCLSRWDLAKPRLQNGLPVEHGGAHEDHAVTGHGGWGGVVNVVGLKHNLTVGGHGDAISIGQGQGLVVIQD